MHNPSQSRSAWRYRHQGINYQFSIAKRYASGDVLGEAEAEVLNRVMAENVSHNMRNEFKRACAVLLPGETLSREAVEELQSRIEGYAERYRFETPSLRGGGVSGTFEHELRRVALERLEAECRRVGRELTGEEIDQVLGQYTALPEVQHEAERRVQALAQIASSSLEELL